LKASFYALEEKFFANAKKYSKAMEYMLLLLQKT